METERTAASSISHHARQTSGSRSEGISVIMCGRVRERADHCPLPHARSLVQDVLLRPITTPYLRLDATVLPSSQRDTLPALPDLAFPLAPRPFRSEAQPSVPAGNCGHRSLDLRRRPRDPRRRTHRTRRPWITLVPRGSTTRPPSLPESQVLKPWAKPCAFLAIPDANWSTHGTHERRRSRGAWASSASAGVSGGATGAEKCPGTRLLCDSALAWGTRPWGGRSVTAGT